MDLFNENLNTFLTECRNNTLDELMSDNEYDKFIRNQHELSSKLRELINPEAIEILEKYKEAVSAVQSKENNALFLRGMTIASEIQKRMDASTPEYRAFAEVF